jgi:uncharacterized protein (DUF362 family)
MIKGVSIKFKSYEETIPKLLDLINLKKELKKHSKIVLKPSLVYSDYPQLEESIGTHVKFIEPILRFILQHKNPVAEVFIAEGADGFETSDLFDQHGYKDLAERYSVGLIDLNTTETQEILKEGFLRFEKIIYPQILLDSFIISLPKLSEDTETEIAASLSNMLGAFPSQFYKGFFSKTKNKIRKWPIYYSIHDINLCKTPDFTIIDASEQGHILAGQALEMDKQASKLLNLDWKSIQHLRLIDESQPRDFKKENPPTIHES